MINNLSKSSLIFVPFNIFIFKFINDIFEFKYIVSFENSILSDVKFISNFNTSLARDQSKIKICFLIIFSFKLYFL